MPEWWVAQETPQKLCFGVSQGLNPIDVEVGINLWYPVCSLSLADWLSWDSNLSTSANALWLRTRDLLDGACKPKYFGWGYDNDTPLLSWTLLEHWGQTNEIIPFACDVSFTTPPPQQPFCNVKTDPQCIYGCKPNAVDADCQPNPNYKL